MKFLESYPSSPETPSEEEVSSALARLKEYTALEDRNPPTSFSPYPCLDDIKFQSFSRNDDLASMVAILDEAYWRAGNGRLPGRLGLNVYDYVWRHSKENRLNFLFYHGSPYSAEELEGGVFRARQPMRSDPTFPNGPRFIHGDPGVCVSNTFEEPILLAIFNGNASHIADVEGLREQPFTLTRHATPRAVSLYPNEYYNDPDDWVAHHITTKNFLELLWQHDAHGYVYPIIVQPSGPLPQRVRKAEYRLPGEVAPSGSIRVSLLDLPGDLLVVDGGVEDIMTFQEAWNSLGNPVEASRQTGIKVDTLQGYWPEALFQPPNRIH